MGPEIGRNLRALRNTDLRSRVSQVTRDQKM